MGAARDFSDLDRNLHSPELERLVALVWAAAARSNVILVMKYPYEEFQLRARELILTGLTDGKSEAQIIAEVVPKMLSRASPATGA